MTILRRLLGVLFVLVGCTAVIATGLALLWPERLQQSYRPPLPRVETAEPVAAPHPGAPIGMLEIPRLGLSSVVLEGDEIGGGTMLFGVEVATTCGSSNQPVILW